MLFHGYVLKSQSRQVFVLTELGSRVNPAQTGYQSKDHLCGIDTYQPPSANISYTNMGAIAIYNMPQDIKFPDS